MHEPISDMSTRTTEKKENKPMTLNKTDREYLEEDIEGKLCKARGFKRVKPTNAQYSKLTGDQGYKDKYIAYTDEANCPVGKEASIFLIDSSTLMPNKEENPKKRYYIKLKDLLFTVTHKELCDLVEKSHKKLESNKSVGYFSSVG